MEDQSKVARPSEQYFTNKDGQKLYCRYWNEDKIHQLKGRKPRALVFICHGFAEHCLWYTELAEHLIDRDLYVFSHDHVGHGQSEGDRAHISKFETYSRDLFDHIDDVKKSFPNLPVFLVGHSMGGTVSIEAGLAQPDYFTGMVLIGPAIIPDKDAVHPCKIFFGKMVAHILPQLQVQKLDSKAVSRDPDVVKKYEDDPLIYHGGIKTRWGIEFLHTIQKVEESLDKITWPFLIVHGEHDKLCDIEGSKLMFDKAKSKDKDLKVYPNCFHQLHNELEPDKSTTIKDMLDWISDRMPRS